MWKDLSFSERAELISRWRKEHVTDYGRKIREYDESHRFDDGGDTNPMNYEYRGTVYDDDLRNQGITHLGVLPETVVTGKAPDRPYFSSYDPMALYRYGIEPALEGVGKVYDKALENVDDVVDAATSPAWWVNKAITGNSDNTVQGVRDWVHTAMRDAPMLLSPTRDIGMLRTGFEYAPWNPENPGIAGSDYEGQAMNNVFDFMLAPLGPAALKGGAKALADTPRARAAVYNNVTPYSYGNQDLGTFKVKKIPEFIDAAKDFVTPKRIDTSYPKWKQRYDEHLAAHPEEALVSTMFDYDTISLPATMEFRDQAWAKAMRQPDSDRWTAKIYKDNGDGTWSYDLDAVDAIRSKYNSGTFSGALSDDPPIDGYHDNITTNGGGVGIQTLPDGTYRMVDTWDLQPFLSKVNNWLNPNIYANPTVMQEIVGGLPRFMKNGLRKAGEFEAIDFFGGDPFKIDFTWDPNAPRFLE